MINYISYLAAILSSIAFLPKGYYVYKTKNTRDLVLKSLIMYFIAQILWLYVGLMYKDPGMCISALINIIVYFYMLYAKYKYDKEHFFLELYEIK
tara:strand:+ start:233 stop:517 length:285 start_codon:yes stop_codon:yes gene_type:complete